MVNERQNPVRVRTGSGYSRVFDRVLDGSIEFFQEGLGRALARY